MKELEAIREFAGRMPHYHSLGVQVGPCWRCELEALLPALDRAIAEHERLAVAAARRDAIEKCRIALRANFLGPQAEELCGMFTRWMRDDAQTLDAHDADTRNRALEEMIAKMKAANHAKVTPADPPKEK